MKINLNKNIIASILFTILSTPSYSSIFADDEARKVLLEHKKQTELNISQINNSLEEQKKDLDRITKNQLSFQGDTQNLMQRISKLNGDIEQQTFQIEQLKKRQTDLYKDLDSRILKIEQAFQEEKNINAKKEEIEKQHFQDGIDKFKNNKIKEANLAFSSFLQKYPHSERTPNVLFWLGNSFYAQGNCNKAISSYERLIKEFSSFEKTSEVMLVISSCQEEMKKTQESKKTLESIIKEYPNSEAAKEAKLRLSKYLPTKSNKKK